jgi:proton-dependent oligopeptide transporter, POT family
LPFLGPWGFDRGVAANPVANPGKGADGKFPPQVAFIIGNEACERFSFYGMKGILAGYITGEMMKGGLGQSADKATEWIHLFIMLNYFTPLLGAWISDKIWGRYKTILWISLLYCLGHGVLALADVLYPMVAAPAPLVELTETAKKAWEVSNRAAAEGRMWMLGAGLTLIAFGAGGIKPCVSAFMGDQFVDASSKLYERAYAAFYFSINFGSFFSFLTIPWVARNWGYSWAFGIPGILMGLATLIFYLGSSQYRKVAPARETRSAGFFPVLFEALRNRQPGRGFWEGALAGARFSPGEVKAAASVAPVLSVFALIPPFWAMFDQHSSTWVLQAKKMNSIEVVVPGFGWKYTVGGEEMQSLNPLLVMLLVPLVTLVLYPAFGRITKVTPLRRIGVGMFVAGLSYVVVAWIQQRVSAGEKLSVLWQAVPYTILTTAEVLVSTTGLEFAYTQAAKSMKSTIVSFWLLTVAAGNFLVAMITKFGSKAVEGQTASESVTAGRFLTYALMTFAVAIVFVFVAMAYRYRDAEAGESKT